MLPDFVASMETFLQRELLPALRSADDDDDDEVGDDGLMTSEKDRGRGREAKRKSSKPLTLKDVASRIFFSVFSNGSTDSTADLIESLLVPVLKRLGVENMEVRSDGTVCGGHAKRPDDMDMTILRQKGKWVNIDGKEVAETKLATIDPENVVLTMCGALYY